MFDKPAEAYDRYVGRYSTALARALIGIAGIEHGQSALDVGCGPGALTAQLAALLGSDNVAAVDPSASFVDACRRRNPGVRVEHGPAESLPFADGEFDHALAQLVVNFMTDAHAGVGQMMRVTKPGGSVSAAVWDYRGEMTLIRTFWESAQALDGSAATSNEASAMSFGTADELDQLWREVGLEDVSARGVTVSAAYTGYDDLWQPLEVGIGPAGTYVVGLAEGPRAALRDELRHRLGVGDEPFELTARAWVVSGRS